MHGRRATAGNERPTWRGLQHTASDNLVLLSKIDGAVPATRPSSGYRRTASTPDLRAPGIRAVPNAEKAGRPSRSTMTRPTAVRHAPPTPEASQSRRSPHANSQALPLTPSPSVGLLTTGVPKQQRVSHQSFPFGARSRDVMVTPASSASACSQRDQPPSPPYLHSDSMSAAAAAVAELDASVILERKPVQLPPAPRSPSQLVRRLPESPWSGAASETSEIGRPPSAAEQRGHHSMWGELVTSQESEERQWIVEGWETIPPPTGLIQAATERVAQMREIEEKRRKAVKAASGAVATAVANAAREKLMPLEEEEVASQSNNDDVCPEIEDVLDLPPPDLRLHADQQGWRAGLAEETASRGSTFREWVATNTSRSGPDLVADNSTADVVYGIWTCCDSLDPDAPGCVHTAHSDEMLRCVACGLWVNQEHWVNEKCWHHVGEPQLLRFGGVKWQCCGKDGFNNSKYAKLGVADKTVNAPDRVERSVRWEDSLKNLGSSTMGGARTVSRERSSAKNDSIGARWARHVQASRRCSNVAETMKRNGCQLGFHVHALESCCSHCDAPLAPELDIRGCPLPVRHDGRALGPRHNRPQAVCTQCGTENRLCTQCGAVVPARVSPRLTPDAPSFVDGFDTLCCFHPGVWNTARRTRLAIKQSRNKTPAPLVPEPTLPPPPSPPLSPLAMPRSPPPTAMELSPRRWVSSAVQTAEPQGARTASATQTALVCHVGCEPFKPTGIGTQTEEIDPQWCGHTAGRHSQSAVIRRWQSIPREFVIPGDRFDGDHFANGAHALKNPGAGPTLLRETLDKRRSTPKRASDLVSKHSLTSWAITPLFNRWLLHCLKRQGHLAELLPASFQLASAHRWRHTLAPPPSGSSLPPTFGLLGMRAKGLLRLSASKQIALIHGLNTWVGHVAAEKQEMRHQLQWFANRLRHGELHEAFEQWVEGWVSTLKGDKVLTGLAPLARSPSPDAASLAESDVDQTSANTAESEAQTDKAWEWMTAVERRGQIQWSPDTKDIGVQTKPRTRVFDAKNVVEKLTKNASSQLPDKRPSFAPMEVQTDFDPVYGELELTRRKGAAAEDKIDKYRQLCPDEKWRKAMKEAGARSAKKAAEEKAIEAKERLRQASEESKHVTWSYTERAPELAAQERRRALSRSESLPTYSLDGRRTTRLGRASRLALLSSQVNRGSAASIVTAARLITPAPAPESPTPTPTPSTAAPEVETDILDDSMTGLLDESTAATLQKLAEVDSCWGELAS